MVNSIRDLGSLVVQNIHQQAGGDPVGYFHDRVTHLLLPVISADSSEIGRFIQETPRVIITHPDIEILRGNCLSATMTLLEQSETGDMDITHLPSVQMLSNGVLFRDIGDISVEEALRMGNIRLQGNKRTSSFRVEVLVRRGKRESKMFPYGKKGISREDALKKALLERDSLLEQKLERQDKEAAKVPDLALARSLVEKGILREYEKGKFRIKDMMIRASPKVSTLRDLYIENKELQLSTQKSLNKHTFNEAYEAMVEYIGDKLRLTEREKTEILKYGNHTLYTQKTSKK